MKMDKDTIERYMASLDPDICYPIWVISYNRVENWPTQRLFVDVPPRLVNVVVRESQLEEYRAQYPWATYYGIPDGYRDAPHSCGMARQAAMDYALAAGHERVIMLDDDLLRIRYLYRSEIFSGPNAGAEKSGHAKTAGRDAQIFTLFSSIAEEVFNAYPDVVMGSARKQHMCHAPENHRTKYHINRGMTPRQFMARDVRRLANAGLSIDLPAFGVHGEDLGFTAQVLQAGFSCFSVPCIAYDVWSEDSNIKLSSIRNSSNAAAMHRLEWEGLQKYELGQQYLKVTKSSLIDGSYEWGDVDWRKYHKLRGTRPIVEEWEPWLDLL
jgi:hypothetical protein